MSIGPSSPRAAPPTRLLVGLDGGRILGHRELHPDVHVHVAVWHVVHHLTHGPSAGPVRRVERGVGPSLRQRQKCRRRSARLSRYVASASRDRSTIRSAVEPADRVSQVFEIRHRILLIESVPRGIPYVKSIRHIYRRTLFHDPDASASWITTDSRAAAPAAAAAAAAAAQQAGAGPIQSIEERTAGMQKIDGYFPLYWDERTGSMFVEIPQLDTDILMNTGLAAGLGSNDIGLDRGTGGGAQAGLVPARRPARADGAAEHVVPIEQRQPARAQVGRGLVRQVGAVGLHGGRREPTATCWSTRPTSCCAT